ncbi:hypothetical protein BDP27DRAFT_1329617 [Rhodocollybia butyracea]|uniref:Uncharacterized protein n=1 Tax=Rhodocollybia butyracea TaxID=206335 RepID=A0A9P5U4Q7_9AGAR|nr:hypothetical protein BDP27DRAFT_1329617 [Rhodocollybia butyracea]
MLDHLPLVSILALVIPYDLFAHISNIHLLFSRAMNFLGLDDQAASSRWFSLAECYLFRQKYNNPTPDTHEGEVSTQ